MDRLVADLTLSIPLTETSDVVALPSGDFLVVSDVEAQAAIVAFEGGQASSISLPGLDAKESGLEAVAYDEATQTLYVHVEEDAELLAYRWDARRDSLPVAIARRPLRLGKGRNKGVEGLAHLAAGSSPTGRSALLVANEAKPRAIVLLADGNAAGAPVEIELDRAIGDVCDDFSGLSLDPRTGSVLLVSDESATLVEIGFATEGGRLVGTLRNAFHLEDERGRALKRVEGVCVDRSGAWWVLLENACELRRVRAGGA